MRTRRKPRWALVAIVILGVLALGGRWYRHHQPRPTPVTPSPPSTTPIEK